MSEFFAYLVLGIIQGMTYGVIALGMVLIYKGTKTLNFAQPFMGLFAVYFCWYLTGTPGSQLTGVGQGIETGPVFIRWLEYPLLLFPFDVGTKPRFVIAIVWSLLLIARVGHRLEHDIMRRLENAPRLVTLVATIALTQGFLGITNLLFERTEAQATSGKSLPTVIPAGVKFEVGPLTVTSGYVQILIVVPIVALAAALFFKYTKFGVAIRATAENRDAAQLLGISARRVSSFTWIVGGVLAGLAGLLIVPAQGSLTVTSLSTGLLVRALAAALVGGLTSLPGAFAGGIVVGIAEFLTRWQTATPGVPETVFFGLVIVVLVVRPGGLFGTREAIEDVASFIPAVRDLPSKLREMRVSRRARVTFIAVGIMLALAISFATGPSTNGILTEVLVYATVGVSLTVLVGYAGQISLGHWALVGVGAFAFGNLYGEGPVPFLLVFPLVALIGMIVALAIGLPALRIRGPYLAVVTVAFALACSQWIFTSELFASGTTGVAVTPPAYRWFNLGADSNRPLFFLAFATFLLCAWIAHNFKRTRTGRGFFSLRENEKAAATFGIDLTRYRLLAFMLSGGMAALAGSMLSLRAGTGGISALDFPAELSLLLVAMVIIGGLGSLLGSLLGAFLLFGVRPLLGEAFGTPVWVPYLVTFGAGLALLLVLTRARGGLAGLALLPRDPVVHGLVWHERDAADELGEPLPDGDHPEATAAMSTADLSRVRAKR